MRTTSLVGAAAMALALAACGTQPQERVTGGAAAGAATGAGIGALGGPVGALAGAAIGGTAGAVTGAVTEPSNLNLGEPPWSNPEVRTPLGDDNRRGRVASRGGSRSSGRYAAADGGGRSSADVRQVQQALSQRGYNVGAVDGVMGPQTRSALSEFQRSNNISTTGRLDQRTMQALNASADTRTGTGGTAAGGPATAGGGRSGTTTGAGGGSMGTATGAGTGSTGPGGTSGVGSGNQPGTGGTGGGSSR